MNKYLFAILSALSFGTVAIVGKLALLNTNPQTILLVRYGMISVIMLFAIILAGKVKTLKLNRNTGTLILAVGVLQAVETSLFWFGLDNLTVIELLALFWTFPLFNLMIDMSIGKITQKIKSTLLIVLGIVGVFLASGGGDILC